MKPIQKSVYQYPKDLKLAVLGTIPPPPLTVLHTRQHVYGEWSFTFNIIGESHAIHITQAGKPILSEILACVPIASEICKYLHDFAESTASAWEMPNYKVQVSFHDELPTPIESTTDQIVLQFPEVHGQVPITKIGWCFDGVRMQWWTLHTYPSDTSMTYVVSQSFFQCTPEES